jgi:hypothetical protein
MTKRPKVAKLTRPHRTWTTTVVASTCPGVQPVGRLSLLQRRVCSREPSWPRGLRALASRSTPSLAPLSRRERRRFQRSRRRPKPRRHDRLAGRPLDHHHRLPRPAAGASPSGAPSAEPALHSASSSAASSPSSCVTSGASARSVASVVCTGKKAPPGCSGDNPHAAARWDGSRERLDRLEPATGQGISRALRLARRTPLRQERTARALGPGLPDPKGKVNGAADVRESEP